jgi:methionyl-tRNA synthetase
MSAKDETQVEIPQITPSPEEISTPEAPDPDGPGRAILVAVAWPYANGHLHLGHMAGSLLPPDIFARYHRMAGDRVLMVSGSDCHGTPILLTAEKEGKTPGEVVAHYNHEHVKSLKAFGIAFDLFTATTTDNHRKHVQQIFRTLHEQGYLETRTTEAPYDTKSDRFLPDRYVEGTCPHCKSPDARGDQCDNCGKTLDPHELVEPRSKHNPDAPLEFRKTEHFFFRLPAFSDRLMQYLEDKDHWRPATINFTKNWLKEGLKDRPITRDITWGVPIPLSGYDGKCLYVWFEAVCGYLTASIEWSERQGDPDAWKKWWEDPEAKGYYFLGKDNVPFHTIIWPSILMGYSDGREKNGEPRLNLPYDVPANEFLNLDGKQFSKSRGIGIWVPDVLSRFDPDTVRYYLAVNMPEQRDTSWTWSDFVAKVNDELVDTLGNLAHRALTFTNKTYGHVPEPGAPGPREKELFQKIESTHTAVTADLERCRFKRAIRHVMALAQAGNRYFDSAAPWRLVKEDPERAATVLNASLRLTRSLAVMMAPFTPFAADRLWRMLGQKGSVHRASWQSALAPIAAGTALEPPQVLFRKLDLEDIVGTEADESDKKVKAKGGPKQTKLTKKEGKKMQKSQESEDSQVDIKDFQRFDIRIARVESVEPHPDADKLFVIHLDVGELGKRQVVAGLRPYYAPESLKDRLVAFIANLKPAKLRGVESQGMILAGDAGETVAILGPEKELPPGAKIR